MPEQLAPPTVVFPHRPRRGVLYGLSLPQLVLAASALALLLLTLLSAGLLSAVALGPVWAAVATLVTVRRSGRPLIDWLPVIARYALRRRTGQTRWLARPVTRPRREGLLHLPGSAASLQVLSPSGPGDQAAAVYDPHRRVLVAIARVTSRAYVLLDPATQHQHVAGWGRVLASLARTEHIAAIQVLERTVPDSTGDAVARHWRRHGHHTGPAADIYGELVAAAGPAAAPHETYLAVALDLKAARRLIGQAGGGLGGAFTVLSQTTAGVTQAVRNAGLTVTGWLTAPQVAGVIRSAYDPTARTALQQWSPSGRTEADPAAAGPVVQIEEHDRLATDTARHVTYWVENWPRTETGASFLHGLLFTGGVRRCLSLIHTPQDLDRALRDIRRTKAGILADAAERARRGQVAAEADDVEYQDVISRERQLIAGHASVGLTGLLTISAPDDTALDAACTQIETAAVAAQIDLRRFSYQQAEAFLLAALPLARTAA
ncbi:SCO6880 family protein [Streptomyces sp. RFCAC02]|uniref:SCO6880 family protein n=1 Tax=Streptomyces sp. RFCAC02 TaxID=2499143 RepID=UPI001022349E|nr:SCO6880 family protein [Streptomyces sp. RFCAC02]